MDVNVKLDVLTMFPSQDQYQVPQYGCAADQGDLKRVNVEASPCLVSESNNTASLCARLRAHLALDTACTSASFFSSSCTVSRCPPWAAKMRLV